MNRFAPGRVTERLPVRAARWAHAGGFVPAGIGILVLAGWYFEIAILKRVIPGLTSMKPNSALAVIALGVALCLAEDDDRSSGRRRTLQAFLAAFAIVIALATLTESWFGLDFGIDGLIFDDVTGGSPARMSRPTSFALILAGSSILLLRARRTVRTALSVLTAALALFCWLNVIGYLYGGTAVTTTTHVPMALPTSAAAALLLAVCTVLLARDGWAAILIVDSGPADVARRLVPVTLFLPVVLGWLRIWGEYLQWFEPRMAIAVFALLNVIIQTFLVLAFAQRLHQDVEARKSVERELERTSARLAAVLDSAGHAVFVIDDDRRVEIFSRTSVKMLRLGAIDAIGRDAVSFHPATDAEEARAWYDEVITTGIESVREWRWVGEDGAAFDAEIKLSPVRNNGGKASGFVGVASDITQRREAERAIVEARIAAEQANVQKTQFLANMSHELRTPLNGIIGFSYLLRQTGAGNFTPDQLRQVSVIESSGRHLLQLINDILDLSKVETGKMLPVVESLVTADLIEECRLLVSAAAAEKSVSLEADVAHDAPLVLADAKMLKQILLNLLGNAVKFTPPGGRVTVSATRQENDRIVLRVTDTGIGIAPADQRRIFDAFEQVDSAYSRDQQGTGLGLTLTRRLVELQGGAIRVESEGEGSGSTFIVELPAPAPAHTEGFDEEAFAKASSGPLVLVTDDDPATREILGRALADGGYSVMFAADPDDLLRKARAYSPRAITLDILMPPKNGWEALTRLKSNPLTRNIPVVIVSIIEDRMLAYSLGAADHLVKPVSADDLRRSIARVLGEETQAARRILVVDDDPAVRELLSADLARLGYEVQTVSGALAALEAIDLRPPDLAIIDIMMPGMSGLQLVRRIRESGGDHAALPVIVYSAHDPSEENEWLEAMVDAVVSKSSPNTLLQEMERITGGPIANANGSHH